MAKLGAGDAARGSPVHWSGRGYPLSRNGTGGPSLFPSHYGGPQRTRRAEGGTTIPPGALRGLLDRLSELLGQKKWPSLPPPGISKGETAAWEGIVAGARVPTDSVPVGVAARQGSEGRPTASTTIHGRRRRPSSRRRPFKRQSFQDAKKPPPPTHGRERRRLRREGTLNHDKRTRCAGARQVSGVQPSVPAGGGSARPGGSVSESGGEFSRESAGSVDTRSGGAM